MTDQSKYKISALDTAFRHTMRRHILLKAMASDDGIGPKEFADVTGEKLGNVSYHFNLLRDLNLIECVRTEQRRGAQAHFYVGAPGLTPKIEAEVALDSLAELLEEKGFDGSHREIVDSITEIVRATGRPITLEAE